MLQQRVNSVRPSISIVRRLEKPTAGLLPGPATARPVSLGKVWANIAKLQWFRRGPCGRSRFNPPVALGDSPSRPPVAG